ncbi:MAG: peptidoglycan-binding protein [Rivularia sp. (in: cyanobacteria)]
MNRFALKSSKLILSAALVCSIVGVASSAQAQIFRRGSTGTDVSVIQNTLKSQGFMSRSVGTTEYYGSITRRAVMNFQRARGLRVDGVVGPQTLRAMGLAGRGGSVNSSPYGTKGIVRVNSYLNVRSGPGEAYTVKNRLASGQGVFIFEQQGSWVRISNANEWVHANYIERTN